MKILTFPSCLFFDVILFAWRGSGRISASPILSIEHTLVALCCSTCSALLMHLAHAANVDVDQAAYAMANAIGNALLFF